MQSKDENATPIPDLACQDMVMESQAHRTCENNFIITISRRTRRGVDYEAYATSRLPARRAL